MKTVVTGKLSLSNGVVPTTISWRSVGRANIDGGDAEFDLAIVNGKIILEFTSGFEYEGIDIDEVFRVSRHIVESAVAQTVIKEGIGLQFTLDNCRPSFGGMVPARPDQAPTVGQAQLDPERLQQLIGSNSLVRFAIRDFNAGLLDRENSPFLFYRAAETLAEAVMGKDRLEDNDWITFHSRIGTSRDQMRLLEEFGGRHRHGAHDFFTRDQHLEMMRETRSFIELALKYLQNQTA